MAPNFEISVAVEGFEQITYILEELPGILKGVAKLECYNSARRMARDLKQKILRQKFRHKPLSESYLKAKKRAGLDTRILIATKTYVNSIHVQKAIARYRKGLTGRKVSYETDKPIERGGNVVYMVTVPDAIHPPSGLKFKHLARIHEYGSKKANIPPRPHWRPFWREWVKIGRKSLTKKIKLRVIKTLKTRVNRAVRKKII